MQQRIPAAPYNHFFFLIIKINLMDSVFISKTANGSPNKLEDFKPDDSVVYISTEHQKHPYLEDCKPGKVKRVGDLYVFVRFWSEAIEGFDETAQACDPKDLWHRI